MKKSILFFCCLTFYENLMSQSVLQGKVIDKSQKPVEFATVSLWSTADKKLRASTFTDSAGAFLFRDVPTEPLELDIRFVGFEKWSKQITLTKNQNHQLGIIEMTPSVQNLKELTVTGSKPVIEKKVDRLVFNVENSISATGGTAWDVLSKTPGVRTDFNGGITANAKAVAVYIDDKIVRLSTEEIENMLRNMASENIARIEVIANPPARYDAQGGAVLNILTKKGQKQGLNGSVRTSYIQATYPTGSNSLNLNARTDKWNLYATYNYRRSKNLKLETEYFDYGYAYWDNAKRNTRNGEGHTAKIGVDYFIHKNQVIGFMIDGSKRNSQANEFGQTHLFNLNRSLADSAFTTRSHTESDIFQYALNLNYKAELDTNGRSLNIDMDFSPYQNDRLQFVDNITQHFKTQTATSNFNIRQNALQNISIYSAKLDYNHPLSKKWTLETGLKWAQIQNKNDLDFRYKTANDYVSDPIRSNGFEYKESIAAAYLNANGNLGKYWTIQMGFRGENTQLEGFSPTLQSSFQRRYFKLFPSFFLQRSMGENHQVNLYYGMRIERPDYWRLNPFKYYTSPFSYLEGNPYLRPHYIHATELSYTFQQKYTFALMYNHTVDYFTNITVQDNTSRVVTNTQANLDNSINYGVYASIPLSIGGFWESNNYAQVTGKREKSDFLNNRFDYQILNLYAASNNAFVLSKDKTWKAELNIWYVTDGLQGIYRVNGNWAMDLGIKKSLWKSKATITLNLNDIFYTNYWTLNVDYAGQKNGFVERNDTRQFSLSFAYKFGNSKIKEARQRKTSNEAERSRANQ